MCSTNGCRRLIDFATTNLHTFFAEKYRINARFIVDWEVVMFLTTEGLIKEGLPSKARVWIFQNEFDSLQELSLNSFVT